MVDINIPKGYGTQQKKETLQNQLEIFIDEIEGLSGTSELSPHLEAEEDVIEYGETDNFWEFKYNGKKFTVRAEYEDLKDKQFMVFCRLLEKVSKKPVKVDVEAPVKETTSKKPRETTKAKKYGDYSGLQERVEEIETKITHLYDQDKEMRDNLKELREDFEELREECDNDC